MSIEMVKCEKCKKFYNKAVDPSCPYCGGGAQPASETVPVSMTVPGMGATEPVRKAEALYAPAADNGRTMAVIKEKLGIDPVVGWLIAVNGSEKGRDYKIHSDNNFLGRDDKMDIAIKGDETISRENHVTVTYDSRDRIFYVTPGEGRSIVRLNDKALLMTAQLQAYDVLEIGVTKLLFIPLCGEKFDWVAAAEEAEKEAAAE